jgi:muconolactone D-isomerase
MDFLVRVDFARAYELPEDERVALIERERSTGRELLSKGVIRQLWRLPGTRTNIGIWSAADADALAYGVTGPRTHPQPRISPPQDAPSPKPTMDPSVVIDRSCCATTNRLKERS